MASSQRLPLSAAVAAKCRECIYDCHAPGHVREQIAACPCTSCPLWCVRPLNRAAPAWLSSRDPAQLPEGFTRLSQAKAVEVVRGNSPSAATRREPTAITGEFAQVFESSRSGEFTGSGQVRP